MATAEKITEYVCRLPERLQAEVLDFLWPFCYPKQTGTEPSQIDPIGIGTLLSRPCGMLRPKTNLNMVKAI